MTFKNNDNIEIVNSFLRLYGEAIQGLTEDNRECIEFFLLRDADNDYGDPIVSICNEIQLSLSELGKLGLTEPEIFAAIAHEIGHIAYGTLPFGVDAESRADSFAAELGLANQMISVIEKLIASRRYRRVTGALVQRIYFLQHLAGAQLSSVS